MLRKFFLNLVFIKLRLKQSCYLHFVGGTLMHGKENSPVILKYILPNATL